MKKSENTCKTVRKWLVNEIAGGGGNMHNFVTGN